MSLVDKIFNTKELAVQFLETVPETRSSDSLLCYLIWHKRNPHIDGHFEEAFINPQKYDLPAFETVRRTRQYLQAERPDLRPNAMVKAARDDNEVIYKEMFKSSSY